MKLLNFYEWLQLHELDLRQSDKFSNGSKNPTPEVQKIATGILSKNGSTLASKISASPSNNAAQRNIIGTVSNSVGGLNPNQKSRINMSDLTKAVSKNLGTNLGEN